MTSIYVIASDPNGPVKIGRSVHPEKRLKQLQTGYPERLILYHVEPVAAPDAHIMESLVHAENRHRRISGEWYKLSVEDAIVEVKHAMMRYEDSTELKSRRKL